MGLIKAGMGAVGGVLADQWKEFFYCDSMPPDVLMMKGTDRRPQLEHGRGRQHYFQRIRHCRQQRAVHDDCGTG